MYRDKVLGVILTILIDLVVIVNASPTLSFPINAQVPPVARVSEPYIFSFSSSTFVSTSGPISYALENQPSWLDVESASLVLSGTPTSDDIGVVIFELIASDNSGSTPSTVTLVVVTATGLELGIPVLPQLANFGHVTSPASLLLYQQQTFAFTFSFDTFTGSSSYTNFYAISSNNSPLPSWIQFDSRTLGFSGTSPPLISPKAVPQVYSILLIASNVPGFAEAVVNFQIVVGYHILTFSSTVFDFDIAVGQPFSTSSLLDQLLLDGIRTSSTELTSVTSNAPDWLKLNSGDVSLAGTPPDNVTSISVVITISDVYGDIAQVTIHLTAGQNSTKLFNGGIPNVNATIGQAFSYSVDPSVLNAHNLTVTANVGSASWLKFDPRNLTFRGTVPKTDIPGIRVIALVATDGAATDEESFDIFILRGLGTSATSSAVSTSRPSSSAASSTPTITGAIPSSHLPVSNCRVMIIVLAVILPILILAILMSLILYRRKRQRQTLKEQNVASQDHIQQPTVHEPIELTLEVPIDASVLQDQGLRQSTPTGPPRVELPWGPDSLRLSRNRFSERLRAKSGDSPESWGGLIALTPGFVETTAQDQAVVPPIPELIHRNTDVIQASKLNHSRKRPPLQPTQSRRGESSVKRVSEAPSGMSALSARLPKTLSGAGHGSGGPYELYNIRSSWQTTLGSLPTIESWPSTAVLDTFPLPPRSGERVRRIVSPDRRATVRLVHSDGSAHSDSFEVQRQKWHTERARNRLEGSEHFSSAWSSRQHSGSRILIDAARPARALSPAMGSESGKCARTTASWSRWSSVGPAAEQAPTKLCLHQEESAASSGQFDSTLSFGSQWEDENLVEEENEAGKRHWQRKARADEADTPSPRLPFAQAPASPSEEKAPEGAVASRTFRLVDNRRPISVGLRDLQWSQRSHQGSVRFV
jgi:axial budding pattern protein 2